MKFLAWFPALACAGLLAACDPDPVASTPPHAAATGGKPATAPVAQGQPQPRLPTVKLWLGPQEIVAEQALTLEQIRTGMMFRQSMPEHEGMLFVFGSPFRASFWMKNTLLPLTCAYIDPDGVILEIRDMKPLDESPLEAKTDRVQFVLEMNRGWFDRNQVATGMVVRTERGTLRETYFRNQP